MDGGGEGEGTDSRAQSMLTNVIPSSDICNVGFGPSECVSAPPITWTRHTAFQADGIRSPLEYGHALQLPYTDIQMRATAKLTRPVSTCYQTAWEELGPGLQFGP